MLHQKMLEYLSIFIGKIKKAHEKTITSRQFTALKKEAYASFFNAYYLAKAHLDTQTMGIKKTRDLIKIAGFV